MGGCRNHPYHLNNLSNYKKGGEILAVHGPFKDKNSAKDYASKRRKKGYTASLYKKSTGKWYVSVSR